MSAVNDTVQRTNTATSCLSSRRTATTTRATSTPTQSPTTLPIVLTSPMQEKSFTNEKVGRKHVKFPDTARSAERIGLHY